VWWGPWPDWPPGSGIDCLIVCWLTGPPNPDSPAEDGGKLKSATMMKENRHYTLEMRENQRGRFLRVTLSVLTTTAFYSR